MPIIEITKEVFEEIGKAVNKNTLEEKNKEIERLKRLYETDKESWNEQMSELQERIDKAIKYINNWLDGVNNEDIIIAMNNLGNILKGEDR